nr:hypothetical protein [Tanacetum cinerariifolium]
MANLTFADMYNMVAFLSKSDASADFDQIVDFFNAQVIQYALMVNPTIYVSCIKQFWATASIKKANDVVNAKRTAWNEFSCSMASAVICLATVQPQPQAAEEENDIELEQDKIAQALEILKLKRRVKKLEKKSRSQSSGLKRLRKVGGKIKAIDANEDITLVDVETQVDMDSEFSRRKNNDSAAKEVSAAEPVVFDDEEVTMTMAQTLIKMKAKKDVKEPTKKRVAEETLLQDSFKKLKAVEVSGSHSTQDTLTNDPKEMSKEDVKNMLEIIPVYEFKVEALQVKYPLIDWEIHSEGSKSYWKIIRVGGITKAYQSFEYMLKGFDREDLDALWRLVKEKLSTAVPTVDKEKALWSNFFSSSAAVSILPDSINLEPTAKTSNQ